MMRLNEKTKWCAIACILISTSASAAAAAGDSAPIDVHVDARDVQRGIYQITENIPVQPGALTLRFAKWLPGHHSASGRVDSVAGIFFTAAGKSIPWERDAEDAYSFHLNVPAGQTNLQARFEFTTPLQPSQGRVSMTPVMLELEWDMCVIYPNTKPADEISIKSEVTLPPGWDFATALEPRSNARDSVFATTNLTTLIDSPVLASPQLRKIDIGKIGDTPVRIDLAHDIDAPAVSDDRVAEYREMVHQAQLVFGRQPPFAHYDLLLTMSDEVGTIGWEHLQSSEVGTTTSTYRDWKNRVEDRLTLPHEFIHAWSGKYRRPEGLRSPNYSTPMRGSLLWIYEGLTNYYTFVIGARSGLLSASEANDYLAAKTAQMSQETGREWRPLQDTTTSPVLAPLHNPVAWPDWHRTINTYYDESIMVWLDVDAKIRTLSHGTKSLDDFSKVFFHADAATLAPKFYTLDEVVALLKTVAPYDWAAFFRNTVGAPATDEPNRGVEATGWKVQFGSAPGTVLRGAYDALDLLNSAGLTVNDKGDVTAVRWNSPAFLAGLTPGANILSVDGTQFSRHGFQEAIANSRERKGAIPLIVKARGVVSSLSLDYHGDITYPHLVRMPDTQDILSAIVAPRS